MSAAHIMLTANAAWNIVNFRLPLMRHLRDLGYQVSAAAPDDGYASGVEDAGFAFHPVPVSRKGTNPAADLRTWASLRALYRSERPSLVCHFTVKPNIYGTLAAYSLGIPAVNNISGLGTVFITSSPLTGLVKLLYRISQRRACRVFFQNGDDRQLFVRDKLVRPQQTALLPGSGIDLEKFRPMGDGAAGGPHGGHTPGSPRTAGSRQPVFLMMSRLLRDKGVREYLQAARLLKERFPQAQCLLAGPVDTENRTAVTPEELEEYRSRGEITYLGEVREVPALLQTVDCVVLPSYREGTPRTLLEAAAAGLPLVAADVPGCRQVVEEERTGFLCAPRDARSLAGAMERILALGPDERARMGRRGRQKMEREYDQKLVFSAYERTIEECLRDARGAG